MRTLELLRTQGQFWLAAAPDAVVSGLLTYGQGQPFLELAGALTSEPGPFVVHGVCAQIELTLCGSVTVSLHGGLDGLHSQGIRVGAVIVGGHVDGDLPTLPSCSVRLTHLDDWVDANGYHTDYEDGGVTVLRHAPWPERPQQLADGGSLTLRQETARSMPTSRRGELRSAMWLDVRPPRPVSLETLWDDYLTPLEDLLSTCTGTRNHVTELNLFTTDIGQPATIEWGSPLRVFESRIRSGEHEVQRPHYRQWMPFTLLGLEAAATWVGQAPKLRGMARLALSASEGDGFLESSFFLAASAAEGLHRRIRPEAVRLPAEAAEAARVAATAAVAPEVRDIVDGALRHVGDLTYRQRLKDLVALADGGCADLLGPKPLMWTDKVVNARNTYAHWLTQEETTTDDEAASRELYYLTVSAAFLTLVCLLRECGVEGAILGERLRRLPEYKALAPIAPSAQEPS